MKAIGHAREALNRSRGRALALTAAVAVLLPVGAIAAPGNSGNAVRPGDVAVEPPTLRSIGVEWEIEDDANRNARVDVLYREEGDRTWEHGLPLFRQQAETIPAENVSDDDNAGRPPEQSAFYYTGPNMFVGSIFDLEPDTTYDVRLTMRDPDGVRGKSFQDVTVTTRPVPKPYDGGETYHVYPAGWDGAKQEPSFEGLLRAYNYGAEHADWNHAYEPRVQPGDTILVHAGDYKADWMEYGNYTTEGPGVGGPGYGVPFDGTYLLTGKGTPEKPITIKAAGDGEVWFDGGGNHQLFNVQVADYHIFDGINIRNTDIAYHAGVKRIEGAIGLTVVNSTIEDVGTAIQTDYTGSRDFYIADNILVGRGSADNLVGWSGRWVGRPEAPADMSSFQGIRLYGPGHVVEFNHIERFHDGIALATYGQPDSLPELQPNEEFLEDIDVDPRYVTGPNSVDIMNNEITNIDDICVEPDGGARNIRVIENRCFNIASTALRSQPSFGGPHYYIRNIVYHAPSGTALSASAGSSGHVAYNNTLFGGIGGTGSNHHFRNNLVVGAGSTPLVNMRTFTNYTSSDYNGFAPHGRQDTLFSWTSPPFHVVRDDEGAALVAREYDSLDEYRSSTGRDTHSRLVDPGIFQDARVPDPDDWSALYAPADFDFRLKAGSSAVDAGLSLPGVTDHATGSAPDLGAYELGTPVPHYGPR